MLLLYLQAAVLDDRLFLRDFFAQAAQLRGPALVLHEAPAGALERGDLKRIAFTGKRLGANLSEAMVPCTALTGAQRGLLRAGAGGALVADGPQLTRLFDSVAMVVLSPLQADGTAFGAAAAPEAVVGALRAALPGLELVLFADNAMSPLGGTPTRVQAPEALAPLEALYPEESAALARARRLLPATLASARALVQL